MDFRWILSGAGPDQAGPWLTSAPRGAAQGAPSRFLGRPTAGASLYTCILIIFMPEPSLGAQNQPEPVRTNFVGVLMNYFLQAAPDP